MDYENEYIEKFSAEEDTARNSLIVIDSLKVNNFAVLKMLEQMIRL